MEIALRPAWHGWNEFTKSFAEDFLLTQLLPRSYLIALSALIADQMLFGTFASVGRIFREGFEVGNMALSSAVFFNAVLMAYALYMALCWWQANLGWAIVRGQVLRR
jgi:hypothetical protein